MVNSRTEFIERINEINQRIAQIEAAWRGRKSATTSATRRNEMLSTIQALRRDVMCLSSQLEVALPVAFDGFVGEVIEHVDTDERGNVFEIQHYLGCPDFEATGLAHGTVKHNSFKNITEILKHNTGKFVRVTIEELPFGNSEQCGSCSDRFKCLTTKVRA